MSAGRASVALAAALAAVSGGVDALCFAVLGGAFASVITGNLVVVGLSLGQANPVGAAHAALAIAAYAIGVSAGAAAVGRGKGWTTRVTAAFAVEWVLLLVVAGVYVATGGHPEGAPQYLALAAAAGAMGVQSSGFVAVGLSEVSTTYLTGTLTGLFAHLVAERRLRGPAALALLGVVAGAAAGGLLLRTAPLWAVAPPVVLLLGVVAVAALPAFRRAQGPGPGHPARA